MQPANISGHERSLLLLLPLILLALSNWSLRPAILPALSHAECEEIINNIGLIVPGLFAMLTVPFRSRVRDSFLPMLITGVSYLLILMLSSFLMPDNPYRAIVCVIAACSSQLACPKTLDAESGLAGRWWWYGMGIALILPCLVFFAILSLKRQISISASLSFISTGYESLMCALTSALYTLLEPIGLNLVLGQATIIQGLSPETSALLNSLVLISLISVPCVILSHAFITPPGPQRLFLVFLALVTLLTCSIGTCLSLSLLILLSLFPATIINLILCSVFIYLLCLNSGLPPLINITNLYLKDLNTTPLTFWNAEILKSALVLWAIVIPIAATFLEYLAMRLYARPDRRVKLILSRSALNSGRQSADELRILAILRSIGGMGNLLDVNRESNHLFIHVRNPDAVIRESLRDLTRIRPRFDRDRKTFVLDLGPSCLFIHQRLAHFLRDERAIGRPREITTAPAFAIESLND